jgi:hypothetical protein
MLKDQLKIDPIITPSSLNPFFIFIKLKSKLIVKLESNLEARGRLECRER